MERRKREYTLLVDNERVLVGSYKEVLLWQEEE